MFPPPKKRHTVVTGKNKFAAGQFALDEFMLGKLVDDGKDGSEFHEVVDLRDKYVSFSLSERLSRAAIIMVLTIGDSTQVFERLGTKGLQGEEFIKLSFRTPTRAVVSLLFHVGLIEPVSQTDHSLGTAISLICSTKEKVISDLTPISQHFAGPVNEVVENIFNNNIKGHQKYKLLKSEKSGKWKDRSLNTHHAEIDDFILPGLQPFQAFEWLASKANGGAKYPGSYYCFYETTKGYNFHNVEQLIDEQEDSELDTYTYNPMESDNERFSKEYFTSIQNLSSIKVPSTSIRVNNGTYKHNVKNIDLITKTTYNKSFDVIRDFGKFKHLGKHWNVSKAFHNTLGGEPFQYLTTNNSLDPFDKGHEFLGLFHSFKNILNSFQYTLQLYGDTDLTVGKVINLMLPEAGTDEDRGLSQYSGRYIITGLKHMVDRGKFNTVVQVSKDALESKHVKGGK